MPFPLSKCRRAPGLGAHRSYHPASDPAVRQAPAGAKAPQASGPPRRIKAMVIVLGIDPGTASTGYGVVLATGNRLAALDGGVISTDKREPLQRRLPRRPPPRP